MSAKEQFFQKYDESKRQAAEDFENFGNDALNCQNKMTSLLGWIEGWVQGVNSEVKCIPSKTEVVLPPYADRTTHIAALEIETRYKRLSIVPQAAPGNATQIIAVVYLNNNKRTRDLGNVLFEFHLQNNNWVIADRSTPPNIYQLDEDNFFTAIMPLA